MNFFVVSAGKLDSDYVEENFKDIIETNEFALHKNTNQKGTYFSIKKEDVLILKYERNFVAYGIVEKRYEDELKPFALRAKVEKWIFYNKNNFKEGISRYGIQKATIGGGKYGTVKTIRPNFGLDKIKKIDSNHPSWEIIKSKYEENHKRLQKDGDYFELHEEIFNFLLDRTELDPEFTFVIRDSNNKGYLDKGYWFHGEDTVIVSFWTGMDHLNKRPAISFLINPDFHCKLVIQTDIYEDMRDHLIKNDDITKYILDLDQKDKIFEKEYSRFELTDYINCLDIFLKKDFFVINKLLEDIQKEKKEFYDTEIIIRFPIDEFYFRLNNIFRFRKKDSAELTLYSLEDEKKADKLLKITIKDYGLIKDDTLVFDGAKWVFITGENGSGKTMLLRAIGTALGNRILSSEELKDKNFSIEAKLDSNGIDIPLRRNINEGARAKTISRGLVMYGAYRLQQTSGQVQDDTFRKSLSKRGGFESLFKEGAKLLGLDKQLDIWSKNSKKDKKVLNSRLKMVLSLLPKLIPDLRAARMIRKKGDKLEIEYLIQSEGTDLLMNLKWDELSSGNRNILNLVSDIIIRLFYQQPKIIDPSELRGIVLIDEIDLHLHPKAQRDLVRTLSETFPLLQFIVTTHSPIPLLGAPNDTAIFVVKRNWETGVYTQRLRKLEKERKFLLPNTLLTSDIFDFDIMKDIKEEEMDRVFLEDTYDDIEKNKEIDERLKSLDKSIFPEDLFKGEK